MSAFPTATQQGTNDIQRLLNEQLPGLFAGELVPLDNQFLRIKTPFVLPDGDHIDLFYQSFGGRTAILTDLGETVSWLRMRIGLDQLSSWHQERIVDLCVTYQLSFANNTVSVCLTDISEFTTVLLRLSQGVLAIAVIGDIF
jgi:hypothetical protein